jgi:hypothetical protein
MNNKPIFQLSFVSICVGTALWFLYIINDFTAILSLIPSWLIGFISPIMEFGLSFGMILFAVGILQRYKSAQIPSIILITCSALNFIHFIISNYMNFLSLSNIWSLIFTFLTFYFPIIFLLIFILLFNDVKQLKIKIFIAIFGIGFALVDLLALRILIYASNYGYIDYDLIFSEYGAFTWFGRGLTYLRFFSLNGGLLMAVGAFAFLSTKSPETIKNISQSISKDISQPMSISDWLITYLIMIVPIVNIVMLFIWGFGSNTNLSKASWAKAVLLLFCITMVIYVLIIALAFAI